MGRQSVSTMLGLCGLVLLVSACEPLRSARDDLTRLTASPSPVQNRLIRSPVRPPAAPEPTVQARREADKPGGKNTAPASPEVAAEPVNLVGKVESELRSLLGPPSSEEENTPGKTWRYRDGQCAVNVRLYPDVNTRQFATLGYEVKSDDNNTDEGKRGCLAQLRSRAQAGSGRRRRRPHPADLRRR